MRYSFLLDENVLHHAVKGVDQYDNPDETAGELIRALVRVCHTIAIHLVLYEKYLKHLQELFRVRPPHQEPLIFVNQLMKNAAKRTLEYSDLPELPAGVGIPRKDIPIVRAALISRPIIVTADGELRESIKRQPILGLTVLSPKEALDFVKRHPVNE